ncbi:MAG: transcription antitermination factor NusB [Oscillospiraceae bacterium]|nr:transcription antitermination factor NusB [Oscillospiraceae bacterium]
MPKKIARRQAREAAFLVLFAEDFSSAVQEESCDKDALFALADEVLSLESDAYTASLVEGVRAGQGELDALYEPFLVGGWKKERLSRVTRTLLRMGIYEMKKTDVPTQVAINEAVELCKKYAEPKEASFLNGILGSVSRA